MKSLVSIIAFLAVAANLIPLSTFARDNPWHHSGHGSDNSQQEQSAPLMVKPSNCIGEKESSVQVAGSRLPDCSHACGSCSPCRLVIVSPLCASLAQAAEPCPVSYRCMCNNKAYPVP